MSQSFDPDKVRLHFEGCCDYSDSWVSGEPFPQGWGPESEARTHSYVTTSDFDELHEQYLSLRQLLKEYRESLGHGASCFLNEHDNLRCSICRKYDALEGK